MKSDEELIFLSATRTCYSKDIPCVKFDPIGICYCDKIISRWSGCELCDETIGICAICLRLQRSPLFDEVCSLCEKLYLPADEFSISYDEQNVFFAHKQERFFHFRKSSDFDFHALSEAFSKHLLLKAYERITRLEDEVQKLKDFVLSLELHPEGEEAERAVKRARAVALKLEENNEREG